MHSAPVTVNSELGGVSTAPPSPTTTALVSSSAQVPPKQPVPEPGLITVSFTVNVPLALKVWLTVLPVVLLPSPKVQLYWLGLPVEALASNVTAWLGCGVVGVTVKLAFRVPLSLPLIVT